MFGGDLSLVDLITLELSPRLFEILSKHIPGLPKIFYTFLSFLCGPRMYYDLFGIIHQRIIQSKSGGP